MFRLKMLVFAAAVSAAVLVVAGSAPASPLTSPSGSPYTSTIKAESSNSKLHGPFVTVACAKASFEAKVESHNSTSAEGKLSSLVFNECDFAVTVLKPGSIKIHASEGNQSTVTSTGAEIKIHTSVGECIFTTSSTDIGRITDTATTGGNAVLDTNSAALPRTGGSFFCGSIGEWTATYKMTTPTTLYVHGTPVGPLTSPSGGPYTSTIKAESVGAIKFDLTASASFECSGSTVEGKVESHTSTSVSGKVSSLTFNNCNLPVTVKATGSLSMNAGGVQKGTVIARGAIIDIHTPWGQCRYATGAGGVDIGTLTDSSATGENAVLHTEGTLIPVTEGSFSCGSSGQWTGSYKVTTPSTLYVH